MLTRPVTHMSSQLARLIVFALAAFALSAAATQPAHATQAPLAPAALLQFSSHGQVVGFRAGGFNLTNGTYALQVQFVGAHPVAPMSDASSTEKGSGAPPLSRVTYAELWDGITLTYDASRGLLTSSYRIEPRADVRAIQLHYNAPVTLNADGTLALAYATGRLAESAPQAWQEVAGVRVPVRVAFELRGEREVGFAVGAYDAARPLFIDPTYTWNTFLGGEGLDEAVAIVVDGSGNLIVAGCSGATWQGTNPPLHAFSDTANGFIAKLDSGGAILWNTFLPGCACTWGKTIALDTAGNVYLAGGGAGAWDGMGSPIRAYTGNGDAFVAMLSPDGLLGWYTYLGGDGMDQAYAVEVDPAGNVYAVGNSDYGWQGSSPPVRAYSNDIDAFVAKLDSKGALLWNTFLGGSNWDEGFGLAVYGNDAIYVTGESTSTWQGASAPLRAFNAIRDAYVAKLNGSGGLIWNTFLGGSGEDSGHGIAVDGEGNVLVLGSSTATWQGTNSPVRAHSGAGGYDAFVAKLSAGGGISWNTFLGGDKYDYGYGIAVDEHRNVYVTGSSLGPWDSSVPPNGIQMDAFAAKLNESGGLRWHTLFGGYGFDYGLGIAVDGIGNAYVAGYSDPIVGDISNATWGVPIRPFTSGNYDGFVAQIGAFDVDLPVMGR